MIVVKCIGTKKDVLQFDECSDISAQQLRQKMSETLKVDIDTIVLKFRGKKLDNSEPIIQGMKLMGFIQKRSLVTPAAPPPLVKGTNIFDEKPTKCVGYKKQCNFYGRNDTEGYCSLCYKRKFKESKELEKLDDPIEPLSKKTKIESDNQTLHFAPLAPPPLQTDLTRCWNCRKKIGLLGFECHCGYKFCGKHRYPEKHKCSYDFAKTQREQLRKQLNSYSIENNKINRI